LLLTLALLLSIFLTALPASATEAEDNIITAPNRVVGYFPSYRFEYIDEVDFSACTHVNLSFLNCRNGVFAPTLVEANHPMGAAEYTEFVEKVHAAGAKALIAIGGGEHGALGLDLSTAASRTQFINNIMYYVDTYGFDGVDLDLEEYSNPIVKFFGVTATELKQRLGEKELSCATAKDYVTEMEDSAFNAFDFVNIMAYDQPGSGGDGPDGTIAYGVYLLNYFANRGISTDKLVLGTPFYMYVDNGALTYAQALASKPEVCARMRQELPEKCKLSRYYGGIMIWEIGQDSFDDRSLLKIIDENINGQYTVDGYSTAGIQNYDSTKTYTAGSKVIYNNLVFEAISTVETRKFPGSSPADGLLTMGPWKYLGVKPYTLEGAEKLPVTSYGSPVNIQVSSFALMGLTGSSYDCYTAHLAWGAPAGYAAEGYTINYGSTAIWGSSPNTCVVLNNLTPGASYSLKVYAITPEGTKSQAGTVSFTVPGELPYETNALPDYPAWSSGTHYGAGVKVIYDSKVWVSQWPGSNETPSATGGNMWKLTDETVSVPVTPNTPQATICTEHSTPPEPIFKYTVYKIGSNASYRSESPNEPYAIAAQARLFDGRGYAVVRDVADTLGFKVGYDAASDSITVSYENQIAYVKPGSTNVKIYQNGVLKDEWDEATDQVLRNVDGRTYAPSRFMTVLAQKFGFTAYRVYWLVDESGEYIIYSSKSLDEAVQRAVLSPIIGLI
jgi:hypothetical protein